MVENHRFVITKALSIQTMFFSTTLKYLQTENSYIGTTAGIIHRNFHPIFGLERKQQQNCSCELGLRDMAEKELTFKSLMLSAILEQFLTGVNVLIKLLLAWPIEVLAARVRPP